MAGGERLNAGDARNDLILEGDSAPGGDLSDDSQRAVIQTGVTPDQESAALVFREVLSDQSLVEVRPLRMPRRNGGFIFGRGAIAFGILHLEGPVAPALDVALADFGAQAFQVFFLAALVGNEKHVDLLEGLHCLDRQVLRVAGPDADEEHPSH